MSFPPDSFWRSSAQFPDRPVYKVVGTSGCYRWLRKLSDPMGTNMGAIVHFSDDLPCWERVMMEGTKWVPWVES